MATLTSNTHTQSPLATTTTYHSLPYQRESTEQPPVRTGCWSRFFCFRNRRAPGAEHQQRQQHRQEVLYDHSNASGLSTLGENHHAIRRPPRHLVAFKAISSDALAPPKPGHGTYAPHATRVEQHTSSVSYEVGHTNHKGNIGWIKRGATFQTPAPDARETSDAYGSASSHTIPSASTHRTQNPYRTGGQVVADEADAAATEAAKESVFLTTTTTASSPRYPEAQPPRNIRKRNKRNGRWTNLRAAANGVHEADVNRALKARSRRR